MAKNVDLTSREWRDLIFEGKNKEFGAYVLRKNSESRHTLASVYVLIGLCVVAGLIYAWSLYSDYQAEQAAIEAKQRAEQMSQAQLAQMEEVPEEEEEIEEQKFEQPEIEVPQEVLATVQVTQIAIVDAEEVKNEIMDQEAQQEDNTERGVVNQEGSDDADKFQRWLLEAFDDSGETVMFAPGAPFYETPGSGINEVRIAYVLKQQDLERAMELLKLGIARYRAECMTEE